MRTKYIKHEIIHLLYKGFLGKIGSQVLHKVLKVLKVFGFEGKPTLTSGEGKQVGMVSPRGCVSRAGPRMELMCWAMTFCCSTLQWFSRDRMTGYSDVWGWNSRGGYKSFPALIAIARLHECATVSGSNRLDNVIDFVVEFSTHCVEFSTHFCTCSNIECFECLFAFPLLCTRPAG